MNTGEAWGEVWYMIDGLTYFREINFFSVFLRMACAMVCGGIIGTEREYKRRSAGFRTHILICLGACIAALTGQFLSINLHYTTDMARLGAQVVAGIGFIGAGAIILTPQNQVRGLTTSAGLWAASIMGLAFGSGFYEGGFITTVLILVAEIVFSKYEFWVRSHTKGNILYIEYIEKSTLDLVLNELRAREIKADNIEAFRSGELNAAQKKMIGAYLHVSMPNRESADLVSCLSNIRGVERIELW